MDQNSDAKKNTKETPTNQEKMMRAAAGASSACTSHAAGRCASHCGLGYEILTQRLSLPSLHCTRFRELSSVAKPGSYFAQKKAAKEHRRKLYEKKLERIERLKTRRDGAVKGEKRNAFRAYFMKKKMDERYMDREARRNGLDWKIDVAVILQRYNILLPDKEKWEIDFNELHDYLEEVREPDYPKELIADEKGPVTESTEERDKAYMRMFPKGYVHPPSRVTEADSKGNVGTIDRQLTKNVFLFVKEGDSTHWHLPTVSLEDGETLLVAGRRAMAERVGPNLDYWCPSHAPMAVDMVKIPSEEERKKSGFFGTKTFFMKFVHYSGDLSELALPLKEFAWLTKDEIKERVKSIGEKSDDFSKFYHYVL